MRISIQGRKFGLDLSDRDYSERRLGFALGRFCDRVERATLTVEDVNGPRGGLDKAVRMVIVLKRGEPIVVTSEGLTVREATDLAAERAKRAVSRHVGRRRRRRNNAAPGPRRAVEA